MPGKIGTITFDDATFAKLVNGETLQLPVRPDTVHLRISLDPRSKYRKTYSDILKEAINDRRIFSLPRR